MCYSHVPNGISSMARLVSSLKICRIVGFLLPLPHFLTISYNMKYLFEACTANMKSVEQAAGGGAQRIELCSALPLGGLTPSIGMIKAVRHSAPHLTIHLLVRPREGDFVYQEDEIAVMERDMAEAQPFVDGFVCGALLPNGDIDMATMRRLVKAACGKPVTFHRAFDVCRDPVAGLEQVIDLGCSRLLTSGQRPTAVEGIPLLRRLHALAAGRIIVMPGGGVNENNVRQIVEQTEVSEIHGSASSSSGVTNSVTVKKIIDALNNC